ncbi:hypothetical protein PR048_021337 [Dryococelus australis]|uniref:Uncharacterized protein n=1 Tax=Dryococelus australis TaxID=614101 RepID=A0ABQ9GXZ0_9NEOP|nr:hypothetical protein PR048_021337 [Dryococelus australis]
MMETCSLFQEQREASSWNVFDLATVRNELHEGTVNFMLPHGPSSGYCFPDRKQQAYHACSVQLHSILKTIHPPLSVGASARVHYILDADTKSIEQLFSAYNGL